jgi:hypothetical protein
MAGVAAMCIDLFERLVRLYRMKTKKKGKVIVGRLLRVTACGRHGWYEAQITDEKGTATVEIRKPLS